MKLPFVQIDAFADRPFTGNSAAVMPLDGWLDDATLQAIAMENNLSETAFLVPARGEADYELRWFTPAAEVAMCGHATLASGHYLLASGGDLVRFRTRKAGVLKVERSPRGLALDLPVVPVRPAEHPRVLAALGVEGDVFDSEPGAAEGTVIVSLKDEAAVRAVRPDFKALAAEPVMAIVTAPGQTAEIVSRVFVPAFGIDEDPVTGSAHAALTPFWAERLDRPAFSAYQASARGGRLDCRLAGGRVILEGRCVTVIVGSFQL